MSVSVNLKAVLCDLDGTLIDSGRDVSAAFLAGWRHLTDASMPDEATVIQHIGKSHQAMLESMGLTGVSDAELESFRQVYRSYFEQHGTQNTQPFPGVRETLSQFARMSLGVVTTKGQDQAEMVLEKLELAHHFHHVQGARPGIPLKPAPDSLLAALDALACPPEHALMVGDTSADMLAGKAAGVRTCAVTYGFGADDELRACEPTYTVASFDALVAIVTSLTS